VSLDQPLARRLRQQLMALIETHGTATLLVTHDPEEAVSLADRVLLLSSRPARILADIAIPTPRRARSDAEVQATLAALRARLAAIGSSP